MEQLYIQGKRGNYRPTELQKRLILQIEDDICSLFKLLLESVNIIQANNLILKVLFSSECLKELENKELLDKTQSVINPMLEELSKSVNREEAMYIIYMTSYDNVLNHLLGFYS